MSQPVHHVGPGLGIGLGSVLTSSGLLVVLVALDVVPVAESSFHAPRWVVGLSGLAFVLGGAVMLGYGIRNAIDPGRVERPDPFPVGAWLAGAGIVTIFAVVTTWIALGPGPRGAGTRIPFGIAALLCDAIAIWGWIDGVRRLLRGRGDERTGSPERPDPRAE